MGKRGKNNAPEGTENENFGAAHAETERAGKVEAERAETDGAEREETRGASPEDGAGSGAAKTDAGADSGKGRAKKAKGKKGGKAGQSADGADKASAPERAKKPEKYNYVITNRNVRKHARKRGVAIFMLVFILVTVVLGAIVYGISLMIQHNNLKILVDKPGANVFSLSSTASFEVGTEVLALGGPRYMDNVSLMDFYGRIPDIRAAEGSYLPEESKFLAATFYLKNLTDKAQTYSEAVALTEITQNLDSALRILLVKEKGGEATETVWAKANPVEGGSPYDETAVPEEVVPGQWFARGGKFADTEEDIWIAEPFASQRYAFYNTENRIEPGEIVKYSVAVWLEGWDKDCVDERLGGTIKLELQFIQS